MSIINLLMSIIKILRTKSQSKLSGFISCFVLISLLAWAILPASAAGIEASREVSAKTVYPGESFTVTIYIKANHDVEALTLDEDLPDGWQVKQSENNRAMFEGTSTFKASTLEWVWIDNLSAGKERSVVYNVTVPSNSKPGNVTISGRVSAYSVPATPVKGVSEIIVMPQLLESDFSASPLLGTAPLTVQFTDLSAFNPDSWEWDFDGDGNLDSNEKSPAYTYENPGTYTVILKATNNTYGNNIKTKTRYITVTEMPPTSEESGKSVEDEESGGSGGGGGSGGSGGSGGGGGTCSPEPSRNIELKEISNERVFKGIHTCFTFKSGTNDIVTVEFDPKKSFGKITAIVEMLKGTSSIVKEPAPGTVYRNVNVWIGNSGFSSPENLENSRISFRVSKVWITEQAVSESTIVLYRYNGNTWSPLPTTLSKEDKVYFYFTAETPGFSPFAISSIEERTQSIEISSSKVGVNQNQDEGKQADKENQGFPASNMEKKGKESSPGFEAIFVAGELLVLYAALKKKR